MSPLTELITGAKAYGWGSFALSTSFESISTITVGSGGTTNAEFTSIPTTYKHLQVRASIRTTRDQQNSLFYYINGNNSTSVYTSHYMSTDGSTISSTGLGFNNYQGLCGVMPGTNVSNNFGTAVFDILDYTNTGKNKTIRYYTGWDGNGSGWVQYGSNLFASTSAITSIRFSFPEYGIIAENSRFALYGIKGAA